ncbi:hypothetical protein SY88_03010 [Clostridiales bacterium PH28_bin88]|nr:hypothetical protein SY88_03010 [Clostridiales bacterium PH28_bin88]
MLLSEAVEGAKEAGVRVDVLRLADLNIETCRGCLSCVYKGTCAVTGDDMPRLIDKVLAADGLIVAAPTYLLSPTAVIKRACDRGLMLSPYLEKFSGRQRVAVTITVAGNARWNPLGVELLNQFALAFGYRVLDYLEAYSPGPAEVLLQPEIPERARELGRKVALGLIQGITARQAGETQCPICYSRALRLDPDGSVTCPICLARGNLVPTSAGHKILFDPESLKDHFWSPEHRRFHLADWIVPSRDKYLTNRPRLKELLAKYRN